MSLLDRDGVPFSEVSAHRATLEEAYLELTRDAVEFRAARHGGGRDEPTPSATASPAARGMDEVPDRPRLGDRHGWSRRWSSCWLGLLPAAMQRHLRQARARLGVAVLPVGPRRQEVTDILHFVHRPLDRRRQHHRPGRRP